MEAVPKLPMMSFELKISPVCPDFAAPFKRFITRYYGEDGDLYDREIMELENLRNNSCRVVRDFTGCSMLKRYYAQIYSLWNRFSVFESGEVGVQCVWADIYTGQTNIGDLNFELACVLYNVGALHAELGSSDQRQTADSMKVSCTHFQCAAWAFQHLIDNQLLCRSSNDLSNDVLQFLVQIMYAQAQECILEKSMLDNRKSSIVAKVSAQVVEYYRSAITMLQQGAMNTSSSSSITEIIGSKLFKEWKKFVEFKLHYYGAISSLYMGNMSEEQQKMGDRVAWYESAESKMKETSKLAKQLDSGAGAAHATLVGEAIIFVADVITVKLNNAKKENDFIYHEKVTPIEQLTEIKGASLVKGIPFSVSDPEICGVDIFARLVPIEAHETASVYSAKKDEILRKTRLKIEEHNQDLAAYLSSLQLDKQSIRAPKQDQIPDELIDICAELSLDPNGVDGVERLLNELNSICEETDSLISESKELLQSEQTKDLEHREKFGNNGPPSLILAELTKELAKHETTHRKAIESNRSLWENFDQHKDDIRIMTSSSASKIASILPSNKDVPMNRETIEEMEKIFDKIEEMKQQREMLQQKLQQQIDGDNILKLVMTVRKAEVDSLFEREIKKYDKLTGLIDMNLNAQHNMLRALTEHNARYAQTRKALIDNQRNRKTRIASLLYTYQVFKELKFNSNKGIEFYRKFQPIVERLNGRIRAVSKVQDEERVQFVQAQAKRLAIASASASAMNQNNTNVVGYRNVSGMMHPSPALTPPPQPAASSLPPIPATGAKLKDYLPYMNTQQFHHHQQPSGVNVPAIPALSYLSSSVSAANAIPLSQNYPPQAPNLQSQQSSQSYGLNQNQQPSTAPSSSQSYGLNQNQHQQPSTALSSSQSYGLNQNQQQPSTAPSSSQSYGLNQNQQQPSTAPSSSQSYGLNQNQQQPSSALSSSQSYGLNQNQNQQPSTAPSSSQSYGLSNPNTMQYYPSPGPTTLTPQSQQRPYQPYSGPSPAAAGAPSPIYPPSTPSPLGNQQHSHHHHQMAQQQQQSTTAAIASTVSYSLPTISSQQQGQSISQQQGQSLQYPTPSHQQPQTQYQYPQQQPQHQQPYQPISSVVPIQYPGGGGGGQPVSNNSASYQHYSQQPQSNNKAPTLDPSSSSSSYYYPAPTISTTTQQPTSQQNYQPPTLQQPQSTYPPPTPPPSNYQQQRPLAANVMINPQQNSYPPQNPYQAAAAAAAAGVPSQPQPYNVVSPYSSGNQAQQQQYSNNSSSMQVAPPGYVQQQPQSQVHYPNQQPPAQPIQYNQNGSTVAATIQTLEIESKRGWPVLMPIKMDSDSNIEGVTNNNGVGNPAVGVPTTTTTTTNGNADALPDILSTMSISNQTVSNSKVTNVDIGTNSKPTVTSGVPVPVAASVQIPASQPQQQPQPSTTTTQPTNLNPNEPKDLLSQFDPLFT